MNDPAQLYRETIRRHAAEPAGYRKDIEPTHRYEEHNPLCGDRILMLLRIVSGQVEDAAFEGEACAICMASASLLCGSVPGLPVSRFHEQHDTLVSALVDDGGTRGIEHLRPLLGVKAFPARIRCATLPWTAARKAL